MDLGISNSSQLLLNYANETTIPCSDAHFGIVGPGCRGGFDFTLIFEQSLLSILPGSLLLIAGAGRIGWLWRRQRINRYRAWGVAKLTAIAIFGVLQLALLVLWTGRAENVKTVAVAAAAVGIVDALALAMLSYLEHARSTRPSTVIGIYLFFSSLFDVVQCRTLWLISEPYALKGLFTAALALKVVVLVMEMRERHLGGKVSPEETSGVFSRGVFWWLNGLLKRGFGHMLDVDNLYDVDSQLRSEILLTNIQKTWAKRENDEKHALLKAVAWSLKWPFIAGIFPRLLLMGFTFAQPFLITRLIDFVSNDGDNSKNVGYGLIGATALIYIGIAISNGSYQHQTYRGITMLRGTLASMIYTKTLALDSTIAGKDGSNSLTLMSTDIDRICAGFENIQELWASTAQVAIGIWLLERQIGAACFVPAALTLWLTDHKACTLLSVYLSKSMGPAQGIWVKAVQERVATTSAILANIKEVKLLGLSKRWEFGIQGLRTHELDLSMRFRKAIVWMNVNSNVPSVIAPAVTFGVYILFSNQSGSGLNVARAFTSLSIISLVMGPLAASLSAIPKFAATLSCFARIQAFILSDSRDDHRLSCAVPVFETRHNRSSEQAPEAGIELVQLPFQKTLGASRDMVQNVIIVEAGSFGVKKGETPLIHNVDLRIQRSSLTMIIGTVGSGKSILLKALLGELHCSSGFIYDAAMSVGYCDQQSWLVNGTLRQNIIGNAAIDEGWYETILHACTLNHDIRSFPQGDESVIGSKGLTLSGGQKQRVALARALYARRELLIVDDVLSGLDWTTEEMVWDRVFGPQGLLRKHGVTVILATHAVRHLRAADNIVVLSKEGKVAEQGTFAQLDLQAGYVRSLLLEEEKTKIKAMEALPTDDKAKVRVVSQRDEGKEDLLRRTGDTSMYLYYAKSVGWVYCAIFVVIMTVWAFAETFPQIWLNWWAEAETSHSGAKTGMFFGVYAFFAFLSIFSIFMGVGYMFVILVPRSAAHLHKTLVTVTMNAPLSFFVATDTGITINRFSQDMSLIDMGLPSAVFSTSFHILIVIANAALIIAASKYIAAAIPAMLLLLYCLQMFYLRTSRQMRHMDLEAKSPLYTHFMETVSGLITIRAFNWTHEFQAANLKLLDTSQKPFYLLYCIQRWLNMVLDLFVAGLAVVVVTLAVELQSVTSAGALGVALISILNFNSNLATLITSWTSLETSLGAIARLKKFEIETPQEIRPADIQDLPEAWPLHGHIEFKDICVSYKDDLPPVLRRISLDIEAGKKVAICGRTGSGKSSLLLTLFRLLELQSGNISIDGIDISTLDQERLRSHMIIIPQEPVIFPGSLRSNIAPQLSKADTHLDEDIKTALDKVGLSSLLSSPNDLDTDMASIPLSHGQKQLLCLARAILKKEESRVLVLDEATSNVDQHTDELMQRIIRKEFKMYTIVAVAHKLHTVMDFDRVVVLSAGEIVEIGQPTELRNRKDGAFRALWDSQI